MHTDPESGFPRMLEQSRPALVRLARRYAGVDDWQDLLQEMCLQLWRSFGSFDGRAQQSTWVYRVALNTALSHVRRPRPPHSPLEEIAERGDSGQPGDPLDVLDAFLAGLDPLARSVLLLDLEGLPREQIADVLGLTPNAVAIRMTRLRQAFETRFLED
ncbi:RNA polymerase sigma factor [Luteimonas yindakuii]|uniref:RNA polymerase sigma factor n=1 Tax=Luteimonas yindakuii TaxID=2565782 RepID=A0A4Z1RII7_9GAMM|nr:RNA polymerase sigma factor [Luteimonas yindakuii]TKS54537.1 RNA polymerase sigma factor [Luteimonas yindakuii]